MTLLNTEKTLRKTKSLESVTSSSSLSSSSSAPATYPIIVHNLDASVEESFLYDHFKKVGPVISTLVVRKFKSSLGYGYVNFRYEKDALCAVQKLDQTSIKDNIVRVRPSNSRHPINGPKRERAYVYNIGSSVTRVQLEELFSCYGEIISSKLFKSDESLGYGYIQYRNSESVEQAISDANEKIVWGHSIKVTGESCFSGSPQLDSKEIVSLTGVIIKGFSTQTTNQQLEVLLSSCGTISSCNIIKNKSSIYGHVIFRTPLQAKSAVISFNKFQLNGYTLSVELEHDPNNTASVNSPNMRINGNKEPSRNNLYVCNFAKNVKESQLRSLFRAYGDISSVKILKNSNHESRGCGFVNFISSEDAFKALSLNGRFFGNKILTVKFHSRKPEDFIDDYQKETYINAHSLNKDNIVSDNSTKNPDQNFNLKKDNHSPSSLKRFVTSVLSSSSKIQEEMLRDYMSFKIKERLIQHTGVVTDMFFDNSLAVLLDLIQDEKDFNSSIDKALLILLQHNSDNQK